MANISRRGNSYQVQIRRKGSPALRSTFRRRTDAVQWARQIEAELDAGRAVPAGEARRRTVADLLERYEQDVLPTYTAFEQRKRGPKLAWWRQRLGHVRLSDLSPAIISEAKVALAREGGLSGRPAAPATQVRYLAALSHVLSFAERELGWLDTNTARRVRRPREPRGRVRYLSEDERIRLLDACRHDRRLHALVLTALGTGAREGELLGLRWSEVDLVKGVTSVLGKNGERRALALAPQIVEALRGLTRTVGTDEVFAGRRGTATFPKREWQAALREAKIEDFHFHDLRHTFASYLAMSGASLAELAEALGHKTLAMVKRYAHLSEGHTSRVVRRMAEQFLG